MTNTDIKPIAWIRTRDGCPDWAEDCLYFQKPSELDLSCYQDEGKLDSTAIYSQETVSALQKENDELRGQVTVLRDAATKAMRTIALAARMKGDKQAVYLESRIGHFVECQTAIMKCKEALQATAPKDE